ncbi:hypothetical protein B0H14DRAFT_691264 [Mycena olivaceomarginata]|nr:hypothetical protein B0H14DRAFT_691264 [Mycena olivaceomarginata]
MTSALNPTARPPKPPALASIPSTPGPELPGGYPRNSVVFANNQWDRSTAPKKKRGLLASFLPTNASTSSSSASPARPRPSSVGHTPGIALHLDADSDSSAPTPGDFPTPGGHTFASRASSALQPTMSTSAEGDYFGAAAAAVVAESSATASSRTAEPADVAPRTDAEGPTKVVEPTHGAEPAADAPSNSLPLPRPLPVQTLTNASPSTLASSNSSGGTSALSTSTAPSSAPSSSSSPLPISSPKPLARQTSPASAPTSTSSTDKPRPSVTYSPSTFGARPAVTKAGSALSPMRRAFSVAHSTGAGAIAEGAEGSTNSVSPGSSGGTPVTGRGLGSAIEALHLPAPPAARGQV